MRLTFYCFFCRTRLGRRWPIAVGSCIIVIGVAIHASAQNTAMFIGASVVGGRFTRLSTVCRLFKTLANLFVVYFIVGRMVLGFGNQIQICTCPVLIAELAYPKHRATYTALENTTGSIGQILAAWITFGSSKLQPQSISWRLPVAIQAASSIFQFIMVFFVPEVRYPEA